jgi:hypothetical protein
MEQNRPLKSWQNAQLVNKFPAFYRIRRFITVFTRTRHRSLSWARWSQPTSSNTISLRSILILSLHLPLGLPSGLFPSGLPTIILYAILVSPHALRGLSVLIVGLLYYFCTCEVSSSDDGSSDTYLGDSWSLRRISVKILIHVFRGLPQLLQANNEVAPQTSKIVSCPFLSSSPHTIILKYDNFHSLKASLNNLQTNQ